MRAASATAHVSLGHGESALGGCRFQGYETAEAKPKRIVSCLCYSYKKNPSSTRFPEAPSQRQSRASTSAPCCARTRTTYLVIDYSHRLLRPRRLRPVTSVVAAGEGSLTVCELIVVCHPPLC